MKPMAALILHHL